MPIDTLHPIDAGETGANAFTTPVPAHAHVHVPASMPGETEAAVTMATVLDVPELDDAAAAGDWGLFQRRCIYIDGNNGIDHSAALALKRRFSLAYLGGRAQSQGGVYMRARPSVFTPGFVERMAGENAGRRYKRYPWLEKLIQLQEQLDHDQYRAKAQESSIISGPRRHLHVVPNNNSHV